MTDTRQDPLRVAVIGTGFGTRVQLPAFMSQSDINVVALCGAREQKTKDLAAQFGIRAVYTDYEQMLVDVQPDIVSITTPPKLHNAMAVAALQAGAHVICEKPLAMNVAEAQEMLDVATEYGRVHATDFEFRYLPARYYQRVLVDQGYVGAPLLLEAHWLEVKRRDPAIPWTWWDDADQGGGVLSAFGPHAIDGFRWLTGREVVAVTAVLHTTPQLATRPLPNGGTRPVTSDDGAFLVLEMEGGLRGVINLSVSAGGTVDRFAIHGTDGALVVQDRLALWGQRGAEDLQLLDIPDGNEPPIWVPDENVLLGPFVQLVGLTVDRIRENSVVEPPTFADGIAVQRVLDAAYESARTGQRVEIAQG